nr:sensory neuron membrane protein 2-like isoform X1 [Onthophagus taurus]
MMWLRNIAIAFLFNIAIVNSNIEDESTISEELIELLRLKQGTEQFDRWVSTPMDINFKVYVFKVHNVDDIMNGATPIVREVGPYIYKKYREKHNITYNEEADTLEYDEEMWYEFDAEASAPLNENDMITVLNVPMQDLFQSIEETSSLTVNATWPKVFQDTTSLFHTISVKDLLFNGYRFCDSTTLIGVTYMIARALCNSIRNEYASVDTILIHNDETVAFSFFGHKTRNYDGPYAIKAGNLNIKDIGSIQTWKNEEYLNNWQGEESTCNKIRGTDGLLYPPFNNKETRFEVYNPDICRVETFQTKYNSSFQDIDSNVARIDSNLFSNENNEECYCMNATKPPGKYDCFRSGFGDMLTCMNYKIITSFPHFLDADVENEIIGLTPTEELHGSSITIEPTTGWILEANRRMQYNMVVRPIQNIAVTQNVTSMIMPILWFEESVKLPDDLVEKLKNDFLSKLKEVDEEEDNDPGVGVNLKPQYYLLFCICGLFMLH